MIGFGGYSIISQIPQDIRVEDRAIIGPGTRPDLSSAHGVSQASPTVVTYSFKLPHGWICKKETSEHACLFGEPPSDAIIIFSMKDRGPMDTLAAYEEHFRSPRSAAGRDGNAELVSLRRQSIAGIEWVEGTFRDSEVLNYYTTYLAGTTAEIAILVTFSVHQKYRELHSQDLRSMMESLEVNKAVVNLFQ
jgi:hypothetical protein